MVAGCQPRNRAAFWPGDGEDAKDTLGELFPPQDDQPELETAVPSTRSGTLCLRPRALPHGSHEPLPEILAFPDGQRTELYCAGQAVAHGLATCSGVGVIRSHERTDPQLLYSLAAEHFCSQQPTCRRQSATESTLG